MTYEKRSVYAGVADNSKRVVTVSVSKDSEARKRKRAASQEGGSASE